MSKKSLLALAVLALIGWMFYCVKLHGPMLAARLGVAMPSASPAATTNNTAIDNSAAPAAVLTPSLLNAAFAAGKVTLTGTVPDETSHSNIVAEAKKIVGDANVTDRLTVAAGTAPAAWLSSLPQIFSFGKTLNKSTLGIADGTLTVTAEVSNKDEKSALLRLAGASAGASMRLIDQVSIAPTNALQDKLGDLLLNRVVEFDISKATLTAKGKAVLDAVAPLIKQAPTGNIEIAGHTDTRGESALNQELSQARAEVVREYLIARGVNGARLKAVGYGQSRPIADNGTSAGQQKNRRIEFSVKQ